MHFKCFAPSLRTSCQFRGLANRQTKLVFSWVETPSEDRSDESSSCITNIAKCEDFPLDWLKHVVHVHIWWRHHLGDLVPLFTCRGGDFFLNGEWSLFFAIDRYLRHWRTWLAKNLPYGTFFYFSFFIKRLVKTCQCLYLLSWPDFRPPKPSAPPTPASRAADKGIQLDTCPKRFAGVGGDREPVHKIENR